MQWRKTIFLVLGMLFSVWIYFFSSITYILDNKLNIFVTQDVNSAKNSILDVWQGFEYAFDLRDSPSCNLKNSNKQ